MLRRSHSNALRGGGQSLKPPYSKLFENFKELCYPELVSVSYPKHISPSLSAFTLSELLLSLIIVGVIAVITVPVLVGNAQKRMFATKLKNTVAEIEQVAQNELIRHRTRNLANTDFSDPTLILSDKHFAVVKSCTKQNALKDCWKTGATGKDKVVYKSLNNEIVSFGAQRVIILKNGVMLKYIGSQNGSICGFVIDVNGNDRPNIIGRDTFNIYLTKDGKSADLCDIKNTKASLKLKLKKCKSCDNNSFCPLYCYGYLEMNNWKMDY